MKITIVHRNSSLTKALTDAAKLHSSGNIVNVINDISQANTLFSSNLVVIEFIKGDSKTNAAIEKLVKTSKIMVLIAVNKSESDYSDVFDYVGYSNSDIIYIPEKFDDKFKEYFVANLKTAEKLIPKKEQVISGKHITAIGCSTGGPSVLANILSSISGNINTSIVIAQHLDEIFAKDLADWLNSKSELSVSLAKKGDAPEVGKAYIASPMGHLIIDKSGYFDYIANTNNLSYIPSVDVLFKSLAEQDVYKGLAFLLTGMGRDGANSMLLLKNKGWSTFVQDEKSSTVFGMPKAALEIKASNKQLTPEEIIKLINTII